MRIEEGSLLRSDLPESSCFLNNLVLLVHLRFDGQHGQPADYGVAHFKNDIRASVL